MPINSRYSFFSIPTGLWVLTVLWLVGLLVSGWHPQERLTWWLEVAPTLIALPLLWATAQRFALSNLLYGLLTLHGLILMLGGAYTYTQVPLGFWMQEWFGFARNNYDKIGHFAQGFIPAMLARELLLRRFAIPAGRLLAFLVVCIALAVSALYELIEWWAALWLGSGADEFLGTQGDPWDTQSDMFLALLGATFALLLLGRWHDRALARLKQQN